jgi:hypothetical protein
MGLGKPLPLTGFAGGPLPTGPRYGFAAPNPYPKLAYEDGAGAGAAQRRPHVDPWNTSKWGAAPP